MNNNNGDKVLVAIVLVGIVMLGSCALGRHDRDKHGLTRHNSGYVLCETDQALSYKTARELAEEILPDSRVTCYPGSNPLHCMVRDRDSNRFIDISCTRDGCKVDK